MATNGEIAQFLYDAGRCVFKAVNAIEGEDADISHKVKPELEIIKKIRVPWQCLRKIKQSFINDCTCGGRPCICETKDWKDILIDGKWIKEPLDDTQIMYAAHCMDCDRGIHKDFKDGIEHCAASYGEAVDMWNELNQKI